MSSQSNTYVVYGMSFDYSQLEDHIEKVGSEELWEALCEKHYDRAFSSDSPEFSIINDGMNGEYTVIGKVLAKTGDYGGFDGFVNMRVSHIDKQKTTYFIQDVLNHLGVNMEWYNIIPGTMVFTHYR